MIPVLTWYLAITALGAIAWPLAFRLLPGLPDRGYTLSRALGLLLVGYTFWLLGSLGFLNNSLGGILFSILIVAGLSVWAYTSRSDRSATLRNWVAANFRVVVVAELLFMLAFVGWAVFRSYNPDIQHTEKPMELLFINGVRMSPSFPPRDPWLAGYAISYYYFGYVMVALLADLTGTASGIAFNMGISLIFALTLLGSYGLIYNLVAARFEAHPSAQRGAALSSLIAPIFLAIMGNWVGFLQLLHGLAVPGRFWTFLNIRDINMPPTEQFWPPSRWRGTGWWWWRASRVINDVNIAGVEVGEPIDEFPFFSFLLGDLHAHVLAIPFVLLALALAFNLLRQRSQLRWPQVALYVISFGALAFLNAWDLPIYAFVLVAAMIVRSIHQSGTFEARDLVQPILTGGGIVVGGILAYLPWFISFSSQAGGILPNALFPSRFQQFAVMFGPFLFVLFLFLVDRAVRHYRRMDWLSGFMLAAMLLIILVASMLAMGLVAMRTDSGARAYVATNVDLAYENQPDSAIQESMRQIIRTVVQYRLRHPVTALFLTVTIGLVLALLLPKPAEQSPSADEETPAPEHQYLHPPTAFALVLILTAAMLTLGPEFVYLRDVFGHRLNTIFKFYYAAWILFAVAAAYGAHLLATQSHPVVRLIFLVLLVVATVMGLVYPALAIPSRVGEMACPDPDQPFTLNGIDYIRRCHPDDYAGILWLQENAGSDDIVLEAVGGQYSYYGRVAMATGVPTLMGWPGHEHQWRGDRFSELGGTREGDVQTIYTTPNIQHAQELIDRYDITYIFVGSLERDPDYATPIGVQKFDQFLPVAFQAEGVTIYRADQPLVDEETP